MDAKTMRDLNMKCFSCKSEMDSVVYHSTDYFKHELLECPTCKSKANIYYHPNTEKVRKMDWEEQN